MARYDREFLVPYLEDICALHLSKQKLNGMIESSHDEITRIKQGALESVAVPELEALKEEHDQNFGTGCLGILLMIAALVAFFAGLLSGEGGTIFLALLLVVIGILLCIHGQSAPDRANVEIQERNNKKEEDYALAQMAALVVVEPKINAVKDRISIYEGEINKIDGLLAQIYGINVIPRWYRDIYPAVYLYDWFSNSRADDLDVALNTLVLEQIKDRLDHIIRNQGEMIINQRIIIANQQEAMEQAQRNHNALMAKLNKIQVSNEERNMYLSMIEGNTAANAYFSAANYLKS